MVGRTLRVIVMMAGVLHAMVMMMMAAIACCSTANLQIPGERIGEMKMMVRVLDAIHQRNIGLAGQHHGERHAEDGNRALQPDAKVRTQPNLIISA